MINVLCFAHLKEQIGKEQLEVAHEKLTVKQLLNELQEKYAIQTDALIVAVNEEYADPEDLIQSGDTVALIPPVSGG
ncbi:molybdopterin converting factor subunit 1 [Bacillus badius]|uniref:Molybdopterin synthase sulfur carrier subunit n=1 Tax=Bacillus badius TaxID=1455 RepID=A0ABR5AW92_BACBA|nr:molybdopterin converting factor subunit 1 [Bacillus badius]KIL74542.1 Molybdenum cofactor biosynthesis protein MoaD [Bacillus badius]KIL79011.1 Molybdenum cofactor biosynthesis protein MoaD [Bacillus badius]KZN99773.1 molybdopterin synthase sulfur carrier subunit [Bacillus badius]KZR58811.1 molybdopterin synthase sulfur carrier subunit [Bacillus badius]MED0666563.1 molybdopterin converting factor subunit 1 [Bacillus badius]